MKTLAIAAVALRRFIRDRANLFFVFVLPIGIIILIGSQFGGGFGPRLGIHVPESGGPVAEELVRQLEATENLTIVRLDDRQAVADAVALGNVAIGLDIPADLTARLIAGGTVPVELIAPEGAVTGPYELLVQEAVAEATEIEMAVRVAIALGAERQAATDAANLAAPDIPAIRIVSTAAGQSLFEGIGSQFEIGSTSQLILFMFLTGLTGSAALIQARRYGVTRRMLSTPTSPGGVILGEGIGRLAVVLVQGLYIVLATALVFQTDWGNLLGAAAIILVFGACGAGGAMLLGTLFKNDQQAAGVGVVAGLALAALGGCMVPLELFPPAMETVAYFTPHAWALDAFADIQRRGAGLFDILPQLAVLAAFAAGLLALATWRMRVTLGRI